MPPYTATRISATTPEQCTLMSTSFQRWYCLLRAVLQTPITRRHSLLFICSVTELNLAIRTRQNSSSVSGPDSSLRGVAVPASLSASKASVCLHHSASTCRHLYIGALYTVYVNGHLYNLQVHTCTVVVNCIACKPALSQARFLVAGCGQQ